METGTPSITRVLTMVLFALSCAGLLLFLWLSFGGTIPFNPPGYRIQVPVPNAGQPATQAGVRSARAAGGQGINKSVGPKGKPPNATPPPRPHEPPNPQQPP